jgi:hypothetical protein
VKPTADARLTPRNELREATADTVVSKTQQAIYIHKYGSEAEFQAHAGHYVERGYRIVSQSWEQGGPSRAGKVFFVLSAIVAVSGLVGLIIGEPLVIPLFFMALVLLAIAARERVRVLSVTYQLEAIKP